MPTVTYMRAEQYQGRARKMRIRHDGVDVGFVRDGEDVAIDLDPGRHTLTAKMDWCSTDLEVALAEDDHLLVEVGFLAGALNMILRPSEAIFLRVIDWTPEPDGSADGTA